VTAASAPAALGRLSDLAAEGRLARTRELLSELLRGVLVQRLVPLLAGGRTAVYDLLLNTGAAANLIREGKGFPLASLLPAGRAQGMTTMNEALAELVKRRAVSSVAALAASPDAATLRTMLAGTEAPAASEG
jgi:twitching motility protein PilT